MPQTERITDRIFQIEDNQVFNDLAVEIFHFQFENNPVYRKYVENLSVKTSEITDYHGIPFLPVELFKSHKIASTDFHPEITFSSSGTSGMATSSHFVKDISLYNESFTKGFEQFFGDPDNFVILALLPSYLERDGSSLVFMVESLIRNSHHAQSGFYLDEYKALHDLLKQLKEENKKVILFGVTFALLDLAALFPIDFPELIIIETGGMKGRRKEIVREELHDTLKKAFGVKHIFSEYGMTELLSQAYSNGEGLFTTPPWVKVLIRDTNDPFEMLEAGKTGGINVIDFANLYSCSFIATQDLGKMDSNGNFEVLGRFDSSDVRGCNLLLV